MLTRNAPTDCDTRDTYVWFLPHAIHEHMISAPARLTASGGGLRLLQIKRPVQPKRPGGQQLHRRVHTDEELPER